MGRWGYLFPKASASGSSLEVSSFRIDSSMLYYIKSADPVSGPLIRSVEALQAIGGTCVEVDYAPFQEAPGYRV